ncbi:DUF1552 domain-containing protein [Zavarzinella formosa]|uniref:DUF1552 domain-containing protein n=1 Tax=Zavarzinella formosa TaxID=360055 RepID=UPI0002D6AB40|nr:DUF1552 domain-containing protein [Zavarzinella formosa]
MSTPVLNRRTFLRSSGVCIGLPLLDAMFPLGLGAEKKADALRARRMLLIGRPLGLHTPFLFPQKAGKDYEVTRYLKPLQDHRQDFTVFSGMSHRGYNAGHGTEVALLTGIPPEGMRQGDVRNTISLDQEVASRLGGETRFASLQLGGGDLSWNRKGVKLPSQSQATKAFAQMFVDGTPAAVAKEIQRIQTGQSILDGMREQANSLTKTLGPADRQRLDLMLTSIREAEQRLQQDQAWVRKPKPKVDVKPFTDDHMTDQKMLERERQWYDLVHLALQTDSTRVIALHLWSHTERLDLPGVGLTHHDASHHGQDDAKIRQLAVIEEAEMKLFADFLGKMKATDDGGISLLDRTVVFHASNLGNASAHTCDNLPILLAGGGFKHAGHVAFDRKDNKPLSNLFVRMLHQVGIESDRFGSSTGVLSEV